MLSREVARPPNPADPGGAPAGDGQPPSAGYHAPMSAPPQQDGSQASAEATPLPADRVEIRAVQFVGTNVEMTWLVDAPEAEAEPRTQALLASKLDLFALTRTGEVDGRVRFSVIASPLDRLFHKIGPSLPLTMIKHTSVTLDLTEMNLTRQGQGLMRTEPEHDEAGVAVWKAWDAGKLLGMMLRKPALLDHGEVTVAGAVLSPGAFPDAILPGLSEHVAEHGGVRVTLPHGLRAALAATR